MQQTKGLKRWVTAVMLLLAASGAAHAASVVVTIENLAPVGGNYLTPFWVGFADSSWDSFDAGAAAPDYLEALAEDGNTGPITSVFSGSVQGVVAGPGGPLAPGDVATFTFDVDPGDPNSRYFSFLSMVLPSNDAFVGNDTPIEVFDVNGNFMAVDLFIAGTMVYDAGTEINDELPANTAFFGQAAPNTGDTEGGLVGLHSGFLPFGSGGILDDPAFANADFTRDNYPVAQVRVSVVPIPAALWLMVSALAGLLGLSRRA